MELWCSAWQSWRPPEKGAGQQSLSTGMMLVAVLQLRRPIAGDPLTAAILSARTASSQHRQPVFERCVRLSVALQHAVQIRPVIVYPEQYGTFGQLLGINESLTVGDLIRRSDLLTLAQCQCAHEVACVKQASTGAGIKPGKAAPICCTDNSPSSRYISRSEVISSSLRSEGRTSFARAGAVPSR